jgi:hypothetical protein
MYTSRERGMTKVGWYMLVRQVAYAAMALSSRRTHACPCWPQRKSCETSFGSADSDLNVGAECCCSISFGLRKGEFLRGVRTMSSFWAHA